MPPSDTLHTTHQLNIHITQYYTLLYLLKQPFPSSYPNLPYYRTFTTQADPQSHWNSHRLYQSLCVYSTTIFIAAHTYPQTHPLYTSKHLHFLRSHQTHHKNITFTLSVYKGTSLVKFINNFPPKPSPSAIFWVPLASFPSCSISGRWSDPIQTQ